MTVWSPGAGCWTDAGRFALQGGARRQPAALLSRPGGNNLVAIKSGSAGRTPCVHHHIRRHVRRNSGARAPAQAGLAEMVEACNQARDPDLKAGGCTVVIRSGEFSGGNLARAPQS